MKNLCGIFIFLFSTKALAFTFIYETAFKGWQAAELTIDYNSADLCGNVELRPHVEKVVKLWNSISTSRLKLKLGSPVAATPADVYALTVTNITVVCHSTFTSDAVIGSPASTTIGVGYGFLNQLGGSENTIDYPLLFLNNDTGEGMVSNLSTGVLQLAIAHELGHVFGLGHSEKEFALMFYGAYNSGLALAADDRQAITFLYPRDEMQGGAFGCATISKLPNLPSKTLPLAFLFLLLPVFVAGLLKYLLKTKHA